MAMRRLWMTPQVLWHEGMLLSAHHFQQNDRRIQQLLSLCHHSANPFAWGIHRLSVDHLSISSGFFKILELEAIMPDGLCISYSSQDTQANPLEIDLKLSIKELHRDELCVYLVIPEMGEGHINTEGIGRFYSAEGSAIPDEHLPENTLIIARLMPNLKLVVSDAVPPQYIGFPIAKFSYDGHFKQTPFVPPCVFIAHDMHVWQMCKALAVMIREKAHYLNNVWQSQMGSAMIAETELLLRPLTQALPKLEAILNTSYMSPYVLYETMVDVLAKLSPLQLSILPPVIPGYRHDDIFTSLQPILNHIQLYLDNVEQTFSVFPFSKKERLFYLFLNGNQVQSTLYIGVRIPNTGSEEYVEQWMQGSVIASDFAVDTVRNRRVTGAYRCRVSPSVQFEMMPGRGVVMFEVPFDPEFIAVNQNLNIFNATDTNDNRPLELVLHVRKAGVYEPYAMTG